MKRRRGRVALRGQLEDFRGRRRLRPLHRDQNPVRRRVDHAADRFGAKRILVIGLFFQAFGVLGYVFVSQLAGFYAVAALVGFIYAGVMPLYAVIARENFPLRMMGTVIGGTAMAGSLGMAPAL